jgi:CheY-like chemotaxis protein
MAMTANVSLADRDACLDAGMNSHIGKPFDIDRVVALVCALVGQAVAAEGEGGLIDLAAALPRFLDDTGVYARFLANYERESGNLLARLEREQGEGDARAVAATLHALKGMALTMGAPRLARVLAAPPGRLHYHAALRALTDTTIRAARAALVQLAPPA